MTEQFTPLSATIGGVMIGVAASLLLWTHGRVAGITEVPFVHPRPIDLQHGTAFQSLVREVRSLLPEEP